MPRSRAWGIAALLSIAGFINYLDRAIVSIALPLIGADLSLGPAAKGVLLSAFFWSYALMQLPMGWLADRYDMRWLYTAAFALWSLSCGFTGLATTLGALMLMRVIMGIGESVYLPGSMKIISLLFSPSESGLPSGFISCGTRAGLALGAPLIAYLVHSYGWHRSFFILGFGGIVWLIPWITSYPAGLRNHRRPPAPKLNQILAKLDRNLLGMCLGHIGYSYYWYLLVTWLPNYLVEARHMSLQRAGTFIVFPYLIFTVSEPLGGLIADRLVRLGLTEHHARKTVVTAAFFTSIALLLAAHATSDFTAMLMIGAASLVGLATGNLYSLTANVAPHDAVGVWIGFLNFAGNLAGAAAPVVTGILLERTGSYYPGFVVAIVILHLGLPAYWLIVGETRHPIPRTPALA